MAIINEEFTVTTKGNTDIIDITSKISNIVYNHQLQNAVVFVYAKGSTVSITNIEFEPGLLVDLPEALDKIAPNKIDLPFPILLASGQTITIPKAVGIAPIIAKVPDQAPPATTEYAPFSPGNQEIQ